MKNSPVQQAANQYRQQSQEQQFKQPTKARGERYSGICSSVMSTCTTLHPFTNLYYTTLYYTILHYTILYYTMIASEQSDGDVDDTGVDPKDIDLVVGQSGCTRGQAVTALKNNDNDIVNAIMELTM